MHVMFTNTLTHRVPPSKLITRVIPSKPGSRPEGGISGGTSSGVGPPSSAPLGKADLNTGGPRTGPEGGDPVLVRRDPPVPHGQIKTDDASVLTSEAVDDILARRVPDLLRGAQDGLHP